MSERQWVIEAANDSGRRFFGPFVDEDEAMSWGIVNLCDDYEPEDWEQHELSLSIDDAEGTT